MVTLQMKHGDVPRAAAMVPFWWVQPTHPAVAAHLAQHAAVSDTGPCQITWLGLMHNLKT